MGTQKLLGKTHIETSQRAVRMNRAVDRTHLILTLLLQGLGITGTNQSAGRRSRRTRATRTQRPRRKRRQPTIYVLLEHSVVQKKAFRLQRSAKQLCSLLVKITQKLLGKTHIETSQRAVRMNRAVDRKHLILTLLLQGLGITGTNQSAPRVHKVDEAE